MTGYVKQNGIYVPMDNIFVKQNGVYENVDTAYVKQNGVYEVWFNAGGSGGDPQDDLDFIEVLNDSVSTSASADEYVNSYWGTGKNLDLNGYRISGFAIRQLGSSGFQYDVNRSIACKMAPYIPQLNVDSTWLSSKGISISGSTASISTRKAVQMTNTNSTAYNLFSQNVLDNLSLVLTSNNVILHSREKSGLYACKSGGIEYSTQSDLNLGDNLNRLQSSLGGLGVGITRTTSSKNQASSQIGDGNSVEDVLKWRLEVNVNYNITFFHAASGLSRTINKTVKFRTYN